MTIARMIPLLVALAGVAACDNGGGSAMPAIEGVVWQLTELDGAAPPRGDRGQLLTLQLDSGERRASGFGGCNRFFGEYRLQGASLSFGQLAMTMKACPEGMDAERAYHRALGRVKAYRREAGQLLLLDGDSVVARYREESGATD